MKDNIMKKKTKSEFVIIRVTRKEKKRLLSLARKSKKTISEYIRGVLSE